MAVSDTVLYATDVNYNEPVVILIVMIRAKKQKTI